MPIGVTLELARAAANADFSPLRRRLSFALLTAAAVWGGVQVVRAHSADVRPRSERIDDAVTYANWQAACRWIRDNTPDDAIVITPRTFMTFKWFAERAEFATWKDVPQDIAHAASVERKIKRPLWDRRREHRLGQLRSVRKIIGRWP
ncbi:MAG: hypothetical protein QM775_14740 [Pirellulales bacterium]